MKCAWRLLVVFVAVVLLTAPAGAMSLGDLFGPSSEIVVYGDASISIVPDLAVIQMSVITYNETTSDAQNENTAKVEAVKKALRQMGINDVETAYFYSYPQEYYDAIPLSSASNERPVTRYRIEHALRVTTDADRVGEVIDAALRAGVSSVGSVQFDVSDKKKYQDELMRLAYKDAVTKAHTLARISGLQVLYPTSMEEQGGTYAPYPTRGASLMTAAEVGYYVPTDITPGEQVMSLRLKVVFAANVLPK